MANSDILKAINTLPDGDVESNVTPLFDEEIEIEDPFIDEDEEVGDVSEDEFLEQHDANIAEVLDEEYLDDISNELLDMFEKDEQSRSEWDNIAKDGIDLLGFKDDASGGPFEGSCGASHPVLAQSVVKFQAKAIKELFPSGGPVRTKIMGVPNDEKDKQANRVRNFMNYQTTCLMPEYEHELDKLLFYTALYGSGFKKTYWDGQAQRPRSLHVKAEDFYIDYHATDLETAERYTHVFNMSGNEILKAIRAGEFRDVELEALNVVETSEATETHDELHGRTTTFEGTDMYTIMEMHVNLNLEDTPLEDDDGVADPYIVTIEKESGEILSIRRNWEEGDDLRKKVEVFTHYCFIPGLGFYGYGYIHLIGGLAATATKSMKQLIDAGTYANLPGGFKAHGIRVLSENTPIAPGEFRDVNAPAGDLGKALVPLPFKEPSRTLFELLKFVVQAAQEFADSTEQVIQDSTNYGPVGTTMALLEQSTKLYTSIHKRMHTAQARDIKILARLNNQFMPDKYPYEVEGGEGVVFNTDFDVKIINVIPVSDPNMPTESHRIAKLNAIAQMAGQDPSAHDMKTIRLDMYRAMGVESPERYLAKPPQPISADPITEVSTMLTGAPVAAAPHQDHDAHVIIKSKVLKNPAYVDNVQFLQAVQANINEHLAQKYKQEMIQMIGDPQVGQALSNGQQLTPEQQNMIAQKAVEVADQLNEYDKMKEAALSGLSGDPMIKLQEREVGIKEQEVQLKAVQIKKDGLMEAASHQVKLMQMLLDDENKDLDRISKELISTSKILTELRTKDIDVALQQSLARNSANTSTGASKPSNGSSENGPTK